MNGHNYSYGIQEIKHISNIEPNIIKKIPNIQINIIPRKQPTIPNNTKLKKGIQYIVGQGITNHKTNHKNVLPRKINIVIIEISINNPQNTSHTHLSKKRHLYIFDILL